MQHIPVDDLDAHVISFGEMSEEARAEFDRCRAESIGRMIEKREKHQVEQSRARFYAHEVYRMALSGQLVFPLILE